MDEGAREINLIRDHEVRCDQRDSMRSARERESARYARI
jgi:hypothetical protein